jgi:O-acetylhomoserine (thiol)-lyase
MKKETIAIDTPFERCDAFGALSMPVYNSVAYEFDNANDMADAFTGRVVAPDYSRTQNPTVTNLERRVMALTGAKAVTALNSGMAAISNTIIALTAAGKNIVTSRHMFGNTYDLLANTLKRFGVEARFCDLTDISDVERNVDANTCCIFFEIITNPQMEVADISKLAAVARKNNIPLVADTTTIPFTMFSVHDLGADIEIVSSTKYLSGGATSLGGLIIDYGTFPDFNKRIKGEMLFNFGAYMTPQVAYLQTLGLETLSARYHVQASNALTLAKRLHDTEGIKSVNYVGLDDNPFHELAQKQFGPTAGAMVCIDLESQEACFRMLNNLKLVHRATNLFDSRTLAIHPYSTIYGNFTTEQRAAMDVHDTTIRLSVGLEDAGDIYDDIVQALRKA